MRCFLDPPPPSSISNTTPSRQLTNRLFHPSLFRISIPPPLNQPPLRLPPMLNLPRLRMLAIKVRKARFHHQAAAAIARHASHKQRTIPQRHGSQKILRRLVSIPQGQDPVGVQPRLVLAQRLQHAISMRAEVRRQRLANALALALALVLPHPHFPQLQLQRHNPPRRRPPHPLIPTHQPQRAKLPTPREPSLRLRRPPPRPQRAASTPLSSPRRVRRLREPFRFQLDQNPTSTSTSVERTTYAHVCDEEAEVVGGGEAVAVAFCGPAWARFVAGGKAEVEVELGIKRIQQTAGDAHGLDIDEIRGAEERRDAAGEELVLRCCGRGEGFVFAEAEEFGAEVEVLRRGGVDPVQDVGAAFGVVVETSYTARRYRCLGFFRSRMTIHAGPYYLASLSHPPTSNVNLSPSSTAAITNPKTTIPKTGSNNSNSFSPATSPSTPQPHHGVPLTNRSPHTASMCRRRLHDPDRHPHSKRVQRSGRGATTAAEERVGVFNALCRYHDRRLMGRGDESDRPSPQHAARQRRRAHPV
ncbi:hypothetical protein M8818_000687 [Zalaria obscura]|uniref:Uncharacterized protein n=1 Tax=Zalaria obscura TaxID=2024903 RepID=A0ACC3SLY7_9PEZI